MSEDPGRHGINWYLYCHNDPLNFLDANGCDELSDTMFAVGIGTTLLSALTAYFNVLSSTGSQGKALAAAATAFLAGIMMLVTAAAAPVIAVTGTAAIAAANSFIQSLLSGDDWKTALRKGGISGLISGLTGIFAAISVDEARCQIAIALIGMDTDSVTGLPWEKL